MHPDLQFYIYIIEKKNTIIIIEGKTSKHTQIQTFF